MFSVLSKKEAKTNDIPCISGYNRLRAWGLYSSIDIHNCEPTYIRDEEMIEQYAIQLSNLLDMKRFGETQIVSLGSDARCSGYSMTQFIDSSIISGHFANISNTAYIDIFSCKYYDPEIVSHFSLSYFMGNDYTLNVTVRK